VVCAAGRPPMSVSLSFRFAILRAPLQYREAHRTREMQKTEILMEKHGVSPPRDSAEF